jgi:transcriptional regulator with XRE-family HTH domain
LDLNQAFGRTLRRVRLEKGLTHEALAEKAELHPTFISLLERGQRMPSLNTVLLLARALNLSASEFILELEKLKPKPEV